MINFLHKNWFVIVVLVIIVLFISLGRINIKLILSEGVIGLIGGLIGVFFGFIISAGYSDYKEKRKKEKLFKALLNEVKINKNLLNEEGRNFSKIEKGLRNSIFEQMYHGAFFVGVPSNLQEIIYDTYTEINILKQSPLDIVYRKGHLLEELDSLITLLDKYLKNH